MSGTSARNEAFNMKLTDDLARNLQMNSQFQFQHGDGQGQTKLIENQLAWSFAPHWKLSAHLYDAQDDASGNTIVQTFGLTGDLGTKKLPQQFSLLSRHDDLPNQSTQDRQELAYNFPIPLGCTPLNVQVRTGDYHLQANGADLTHNLLTLQMLGARPTPSTTLSLGYYDGPLLGVPFQLPQLGV